MHVDAVLHELLVHQDRKLGVDRREHLGAALQLGHPHAARPEPLRHLQADVAGADDHRAARCTTGEVCVQREGVPHRVDDVDAVLGAKLTQARDAGEGGQCAGADDELVVRDLRLPVLVEDRQAALVGVDPGRERVQPQPHARRFQVGVGAVCEGLPGLHVTGEVVRDAADRVVRILVGDDNGHVDRSVQFAGAQRGGDPRVAAADGDDVHDVPSMRFSARCALG